MESVSICRPLRRPLQISPPCVDRAEVLLSLLDSCSGPRLCDPQPLGVSIFLKKLHLEPWGRQ